MSTLRILVPVKRVIDYAIKPRVNSAQTAVETSGVKMSMNPFDELSVEEAVRLREKHTNKVVTDILAFTASAPKKEDVLRTALAMGADRGIHLETAEDLEPLAVAKVLKAVVEAEDRNLVILGKQAIDDDSSQTGQMLAGLLGWGQATSASKVEVSGEEVTVTREVDGGEETLRGKLPMVITTDLRLNEPRYASLPNIMKAKKKKVEKKTLADYGVDAKKRVETLKVVGKCFGSCLLRSVSNSEQSHQSARVEPRLRMLEDSSPASRSSVPSRSSQPIFLHLVYKLYHRESRGRKAQGHTKETSYHFTSQKHIDSHRFAEYHASYAGLEWDIYQNTPNAIRKVKV